MINLLQDMKGQDAEIDNLLESAISKLDHRRIKGEIDIFISDINKAYGNDWDKKEKMKLRLSCALMLFPPSKIRHVKKWLKWAVTKDLPLDTSPI